MSDVLRELDGVSNAVWDLWEGAKGEAEAPGGVATLATSRRAGGASARMVVLRAADRGAGTLEVWTNTLSEKVGEIEADPHAELLFWLPDDQVQIRARGRCEVTPGSEATWVGLGDGARLNYAADPAPGEPIDAPEAADPNPNIAQFAVLTLKVERIDALSLAHRPHRRAIVDANGARWVAP